MFFYLGHLAQYSTHATVSINGSYYNNYVHENTAWKPLSKAPKTLLDVRSKAT